MKISLSWNNANPPSDISAINVYRSTSPMDPGALPAALANLSNTARNYDDTTVAEDTVYYYRIGMVVLGTEYISSEKAIYSSSSVAVPTGIWASVVANSNGRVAEFLKVSSTGYSSWEKNFGNTSEFGVFADDYGSSSLANTGTISGTIPLNPVGYRFYLHADNIDDDNGSTHGDFEFKNESGITVFAIRIENTNQGLEIRYGTNLSNLVNPGVKLTTYDTCVVAGWLNINSDSVSFEPDVDREDTHPQLTTVLTGVNGFKFDVDMTSVTELAISDFQAYISGSGVAFIYLELLGLQLYFDQGVQISATNSESIISWQEPISFDIDQVVIYRSTSPIDTLSLPSPLATVSSGIGTYTDVVPDNTENYYYLLDAQEGSKSNFSSNLKAWFSPFEVNLEAYYKMDPISGGVLTDESPLLRDASLHGTYSSVTGKDGQSVQFDGNLSHADTGIDTEVDSMFADSGNFWATCGWFKCGPQTNDDGIVLGRGGGTGTGATFALFIPDTSGVGASNQTPDTFHADIRGSYTDTGVVVTDDEWHFCLATWDGDTNTGILRLDSGEFDLVRGTATLQTDSNFAIGINRGENSPLGPPTVALGLEGEIDHVRLFSRYLDLKERNELWAEFSRFYHFAGSYDRDNVEVNLSWVEVDPGEVTNVVIYRDTSPIDTAALPPPLATISWGVQSYTDSTVVADSSYHYLIDVQTSGPVSHYSKSLFVSTAASLLQFESQGNMVWYDPSDLSTLFQDTAGSIPVTTDGDPVKRINDRSSGGRDAIFEYGSLIYRTDGTYHWLEAVDSRNLFDQFISGTTDRTVAFCLRPSKLNLLGDPDTNTYMNSVMCLNTIRGTDGGDWIISLEADGLWLRVTGNNQWDPWLNMVDDFSLYMEWGTSIGPNVSDTRLYKSNVLVTSLGGNDKSINTESSPSSNFGGAVQNDSTIGFNGRMYGFFLIDTLLSSSDRAIVDQFMRDSAGIT